MLALTLVLLLSQELAAMPVRAECVASGDQRIEDAWVGVFVTDGKTTRVQAQGRSDRLGSALFALPLDLWTRSQWLFLVAWKKETGFGGPTPEMEVGAAPTGWP